MGDKHVSDLIDDLSLSVDGDVVTFDGSLKNITKPWTDFDKTNNTGHFVPIQLPVVCKNEDITLKGRVNGDLTVHVNDDLLLIQRLENLNGTTMDVEMHGEKLMNLDFTGLVPTGEDAYDADKEDFGRYGKKSQFVENLSIEWTGNRGVASGKLLNHEAINDKVAAGHHFPLSMSEWYDGIAKFVTVKNKRSIKDKDIICTIGDEKVITVEYNGMTVLELDLSGMTVAE